MILPRRFVHKKKYWIQPFYRSTLRSNFEYPPTPPPHLVYCCRILFWVLNNHQVTRDCSNEYSGPTTYVLFNDCLDIIDMVGTRQDQKYGDKKFFFYPEILTGSIHTKINLLDILELVLLRMHHYSLLAAW